MATGLLEIDLSALRGNWNALDAMSGPAVETAAVVKADGYGLGSDRVAAALSDKGVKTFFVAVAEEGAKVRAAAPNAKVYVFSGHQDGDTDLLLSHNLIPLLNSPEQIARHRSQAAGHPFGVQLDSGMNRLGLEPSDWAALQDDLPGVPSLAISHLACADEPGHPMNARQLAAFRDMTDGRQLPRSLAATGGILLGPEYHFDMTRPGVGLYGGEPFTDAATVVRLSVPVIQTRLVEAEESVGYGNAWVADRPRRIATIAAGYADGLIRAMGPNAQVFAGETACQVVGRVSMDLITVDVTELDRVPDALDILCDAQGVDALARAAGTIGYEVLTSLGARYKRAYISPQ